MRLLNIILFLPLLVVSPYQDVHGQNQMTEQEALNTLITQIQKDKLYDSWTTFSCLQFFTEEKTNNHFAFGIHEKHGGACPGDPNTSPIVDRFSVNRLTKKVQWYEPTEGEYLPYKAVLKARLKIKKCLNQEIHPIATLWVIFWLAMQSRHPQT